MEVRGELRGPCCWEVQARARGHSSPPCFPALSGREEPFRLQGITSSETLMKTFKSEDSRVENGLMSEAPTMQTGKWFHEWSAYCAVQAWVQKHRIVRAHLQSQSSWGTKEEKRIPGSSLASSPGVGRGNNKINRVEDEDQYPRLSSDLPMYMPRHIHTYIIHILF